MSVLAIVRPYSIVATSGTLTGAPLLATPDPKEAAVATGGGGTIDIDLGAVQLIDTLFLGYTNAAAGSTATVRYGTGGPSEQDGGTIAAAESDAIEPRRHFLRMFDTPFSARFLRISGNFAVGTVVGTVAAGRAFRPTYGQEYGGGRAVTDTGTVSRLFGGGFSIDEGARAGSWAWTLGDLTGDEVRALYALQLDRGSSRSVLVIEDPDAGPGLNERIHWSLFSRLDRYERLDPLNTKWGFQVDDWA